MTWFTRWRARLDVVALRLSYLHLPPEDREWATYSWADPEGGYHCRPFFEKDAEFYAAQHWERTAGQPASAVD